MISPKEQLLVLPSKVNALSLRERAIILATIVVGIVVLCLHFSWTALVTEREGLEDDISRLQGRTDVLRSTVSILESQLAEDVDGPQRELNQSLARQVTHQEEQLRRELGNLVQPDEMVRLLQKMLREDSSMKVVKVSSQPAEQLYTDERQGEPAAGEGMQLYRRSITVEVEADYFSALTWLRRLEGLDAGLMMNRVTYEVQDHPTARIQLSVETIGMSKEWLGV